MTRRRALTACALVALGALLGGCASDGPVEPVWDKQPCAHCGMVLSDRRFGAQLLTAAGDHLFFDDPGCMVLYQRDQRLEPARAWVRDAETSRWLDAGAARYADGARSPMDYGFEARASGSLGWDEMRARVAERAGGMGR
jgi:copper chaperone NosL